MIALYLYLKMKLEELNKNKSAYMVQIEEIIKTINGKEPLVKGSFFILLIKIDIVRSLLFHALNRWGEGRRY